MITIAFALGSALTYGAADFCGGSATRRSTALGTLMVSLPSGLLLLLLLAFVGGGPWSSGALAWGYASGAVGGIGLIAFYRALAKGPMSVVAPISGLVAAAVPVVAGTFHGERLGLAAITGMVLCLVAIMLVSMEKGTHSPTGRRLGPGGPALALIAGASFGLFFVLLRIAGSNDALWSLVAAKAAGLTVVALVALAGRRSVPIPGRVTIGIAMIAGFLDVIANGLYLVAARAGMLSIAGVLSSLYPASTIMLARMVYGERLRPIQWIGMIVAVGGVSLVTAG